MALVVPPPSPLVAPKLESRPSRPAPPTPPTKPIDRAKVERAIIVPPPKASAPRKALQAEGPALEQVTPAAPAPLIESPELPSIATPKPQPKPGASFATAQTAKPSAEPGQPLSAAPGLFLKASAKAASGLTVAEAPSASAGFGSARAAAVDGKPAAAPTGSFGSARATAARGKPAEAPKAGGFRAVGAQSATDRTGPAVAATGGFGAVSASRERSAPAGIAQPQPAAAEPVVILTKPDPTYTQEARALRLEGDVLVEALFTRSGRIEQIRVVEGLGHGLDEAAVEAVRAIEFQPARRNGVAEDARLRLTVRFQLAY